MHVVAAIIHDSAGRVLLAQRPAGKHLAGMWEFAGGKLEPGETPFQALQREIHEELDLQVQQAQPWLWLPWAYGERRLVLDVWRVEAWQGQPRGCEGQAIAWCDPAALDPAQLAPADRMIWRSLRLPPCYAITPPAPPPAARAALAGQLLARFRQGPGMLQLRLPSWPLTLVRELAASLLPAARESGVELLLHRDVAGARALGVGVHLPASEALRWSSRPLPLGQRLGVSAHDLAELQQAVQLDADFATLSPVQATASHPAAVPLGWSSWAALVREAGLPVYALGGLGPQDLAAARQAGAQGVAGIRGFWTQAPAQSK